MRPPRSRIGRVSVNLLTPGHAASAAADRSHIHVPPGSPAGRPPRAVLILGNARRLAAAFPNRLALTTSERFDLATCMPQSPTSLHVRIERKQTVLDRGSKSDRPSLVDRLAFKLDLNRVTDMMNPRTRYLCQW